MRRPLSLSHVVRRPAMRTMKSGQIAGRASTRLGLSLAMGIFLVCLFLSACSSPFGGAAPTPTPSIRALTSVPWCAKQLMVFRDEGATATATSGATATATVTATSTSTASASGSPAAGTGTPQTITDWSQVKANLGFTVYLPKTLPNGTCLVSAQATIHDPIFGGSFTIGYLLPDHSSLSFSEAPLKSQNTSFQCNPTGASGTTATTPTPTSTAASQLCSGAKDTTNIVLSGPGTADHLQQVFNDLQPNINWIPAA
ncbi:MAG TPA: hypothetical protein VF458_08640 [Ktedonobacteraceae bacterium]